MNDWMSWIMTWLHDYESILVIVIVVGWMDRVLRWDTLIGINFLCTSITIETGVTIRHANLERVPQTGALIVFVWVPWGPLTWHNFVFWEFSIWKSNVSDIDISYDHCTHDSIML